MHKDSKNTPVIVSAGISLLFVTFIVLCLVVFALLSLSTAKSDSRLSAKRLEKVTEYYNACTRANETVARIDRMLKELAESEMMAGDGEISIEELRMTFPDRGGITLVETGVREVTAADVNAGADTNVDTNAGGDGFPRLLFIQEIDDYKNLEVTLRLTDASYGRLSEQTAQHYYTVESWKTVVETSTTEATAQN